MNKKPFVVIVDNHQQFTALMEHLESLPEDYNWSPEQPTQWTPHSIQQNRKTGISIHSRGGDTLGYSDNLVFYEKKVNKYGPSIPFSVYATIVGITTESEPITITIGSYTGVMDYTKQVVTVGCQTIAFAKVKEVYELTQKHQ